MRNRLLMRWHRVGFALDTAARLTRARGVRWSRVLQASTVLAVWCLLITALAVWALSLMVG